MNLKKKLFYFLNNDEKQEISNKIPNLYFYKLIRIQKNNLIFKNDIVNKFNNKGGSNELKNNYEKKTGSYKIEINDNKYNYKIERYSPENDNEFRFIDLITIKDKYKNTITCGSIQINKKENSANIISLGNSNKCLKSENNNVEFKYGDIIFQILIDICKKENVTKIELTDNSNKKCGSYSLILNYLKTLTHGVTHYYKYGFKFKLNKDNHLLKLNYQNFKNDPKIHKNDLLKLIENSDKDIYQEVSKVLDKINNKEISIKKFVKLFTQQLDNEKYCKFISNIYIELYDLAGYKPYFTKDYEKIL